MPEFKGTPAGDNRRAAVVASRFNEAITQRLVDGALDALTKHGVAFDDVDVIWVPGAWELPIAARHALGLSRRQAASEAGMAATTLLDKELGRHPFTVADLHRLEHAYGLRVADLYRTSGPIRFRSSRTPNLTDPGAES